ncbi:MAG: hypothetical protein ACJZ2K_04650 [Candidatus Poseidoniaceae archaeon]
MRPQRAMSAFIMLAIIMASNIGCIGLVPAREFLEDLRDPPELKTLTDSVLLNHTFITTDSDSIFEDGNKVQEFEVVSETIEIRVYMEAQLQSVGIEEFLGILTEARFVRATLYDANGEQIWTEEAVESERKMTATFQQPLAEGTWSLQVEAIGYGEEFAGLVKDSYKVQVKIESQCWEYPVEEGVCTYD